MESRVDKSLEARKGLVFAGGMLCMQYCGGLMLHTVVGVKDPQC